MTVQFLKVFFVTLADILFTLIFQPYKSKIHVLNLVHNILNKNLTHNLHSNICQIFSVYQLTEGKLEITERLVN